MSKARSVTLYSGGNKDNDDRESGTFAFQASDEILARSALVDNRTGNTLRYKRGELKGQKKFKESANKRLLSQKAKGVHWVTKHKGKRIRITANYRITLASGEVVTRRKQRTFHIQQYRDIAGVNNDLARQLIGDFSNEQGNSDFAIETLSLSAVKIQTRKRKKSPAKKKKAPAKKKKSNAKKGVKRASRKAKA